MYVNERLGYQRLPQDDALFVSQQTGKRLSGRRVEQIVDEHLARAGLSGRGLSPHKLRHTAATNMYSSGIDTRLIQEVLGHSSLSTTQIYTHVQDSAVRETMERSYLED